MAPSGSALRVPGFWVPGRGALSRSRARASANVPARERLVVVGNGMVGQRFCERLIALGGHHRYHVTVLGEEPTPAYDRVHLTDIWHGRKPDELLLRDSDWYASHGLELRLGKSVQHVDRTARHVTTREGECFAYDRLVFATGSRVPTLEVAGDAGDQVLPYRTLEDAQRILAKVETARDRSVVVIGGGLLGLEAARALQRLGCRVTVLEASSQVLPRQLDASAAGVVEDTLRDAGLEVRTKCRIASLTTVSDRVRVTLENREELRTSVVVAAIGARACDALARRASLSCDVRGGIRVDDRLGTADPRVYAIGECAHHPRVPHGLVAPGYAMADALASTLMGRRARLHAQEAITRLKLDLTEVTVLGNPLLPGIGQDFVWSDRTHHRRLVVNGRRVVAAVCVGAWNELPALQRLVTRRQRISRKALSRFTDSGELGLFEPELSVHALSDTSVVCNCANVTCGTLRRAVARGVQDVEALGRLTSAGTLCGSCQPHLSVLCGGDPVTPQTAGWGARGLKIASAFALMGGVATAVLPRLSIARSVRLESVDVLWVDGFYKQLTGFGLLGLISLGLTLSLRKRVKRFRFGAFQGWQVLHAALGVAALMVALGHTGFRLGHNLDLGLMLAFLLSALTGGVSGASLAKLGAGGSNAVIRALRGVRILHDWVFWPLIVLLGFHVLKVYYF